MQKKSFKIVSTEHATYRSFPSRAEALAYSSVAFRDNSVRVEEADEYPNSRYLNNRPLNLRPRHV